MKKKFAALLAGAALMLGMAASAQALTLTLQSGSSTVTVSGTDAANYSGTINGITVNYANGTKLWDPAEGTFDIGSLVVAGSAGSQLKLTLSDSGLALNTLPVSPNVFVTQTLSASALNSAALGDIITGTVRINGVEVPGIAASIIGSSSFTSGGYATVGSTFSMDEVITLDLVKGGKLSLDTGSTITPVPEPGTMMLLGAGFLGLAIYGKRRKNG